MLHTWEHFHRGKFARRSNKSETYLRIWADFFWNFGLNDQELAVGGDVIEALSAYNVTPAIWSQRSQYVDALAS